MLPSGLFIRRSPAGNTALMFPLGAAMEHSQTDECIACTAAVNMHRASSLCSGTWTKTTNPKNPEVAILTNTLACACYFCWRANTPLTNTNTVHIHIYLLHGCNRVHHWRNQWKAKSTVGSSKGPFVCSLSVQQQELLTDNIVLVNP